MAESSQGREKDIIVFLSAQIDKINSSLQQHTVDLQSIHILQAKMERYAKQQLQLEKHLKVLEVYQYQNFSNNQRLFNSQAQVDMLSNRIFVLQELTHGFFPPEKKYHDNSEQIKALEGRVFELEEEMARIRQKNQVLAKFRRDISPLHCESTKDVSAEGNRQQLKNIQRKLKEFLIEKLSELQKNFREFKKPVIVKQENDYEEVVPRRVSRQTKVKEASIEESENPVANRISDYYQQTEKKEHGTRKGKDKHGKETQRSGRKLEKKSKRKGKSSQKSIGSKSKREISNDRVQFQQTNIQD